jgi:amidohydrolase
MHACGHDAHTAIALAVAEVLSAHREQVSGTVRVVFQPAEECLSGAARLIAAGALGDPPVDGALGLHVLSQLEVGHVGVRDGTLFASADEFTITVHGRTGHSGLPHQALDPVPIASSIVMMLQTLVSREVSPFDTAVVTVASIHGGGLFSVIPESVVLGGSVRALLPQIREQLLERVAALADGVARAAGATTSFTVGAGSPPTISDPAMVDLVRRAIHSTPDAELVDVEPLTPADDMAEFLRSVPGCYFLLGAGNRAKGITAPHHHPAFDLDEGCLPLGASVLLRAAIDFCAEGYQPTSTSGVTADRGRAQRLDGGGE